MQIIPVDKQQLLETLEANREKHHDEFVRAVDRWHDQVVAWFENRVEKLRAGKWDVDIHLRLPEPQDYTDEYDTAIEMVKWSVADTIELSHKDFQQFVENKWDWSRAFAASSQVYLAEYQDQD